MQPINKINGTAAAMALTLAASTAGVQAADTSTSWLNDTISPVSNPIYFEDPRITSEVRPIYMYHILPNNFEYIGGKTVPLGGQVQVEALQLRYALTDKLALIATKDGYIEFQPEHNNSMATLDHHYGFADVGVGLKYAFIDDPENQLIVTPGFTVTVPTGSTDVYQGYGGGEWNLFVSGEKGFGEFHLTGNAGFRLPDNFAEQTAQLHYSLQADYNVCQYFIPFFAANGYTVLSDGNQKRLGVPLNTELYDLINSGSEDARGTTQFTVGGGFRSRLVQNVDVGVAYEAGVVDPVGIFKGRITADVIWRF
jgi:hypothetical protein